MTHHDTYQPPMAHWDNLYTNVSDASADNMLYHRTQTQFASTSAMNSTLGYETTETEDWGYNPLQSMAMARKGLPSGDYRPGYDAEDPFFTPVGEGVGVMMVLAMAYLLFRKVRISRRIRIRRG